MQPAIDIDYKFTKLMKTSNSSCFNAFLPFHHNTD